MGHNLATDIFTIILIMAATFVVAVPICISFVLQMQKRQVEKNNLKKDKTTLV
jgi:sensor domain CHASE-containing protein